MPLIVVMLLIIGILIVTRVITAPATQTRAYYSFQRFWYAYWPFRRGKGLPRIARPLLKNFVPVWVQVEPHIKMFLDSDDLISRVILETGVWDEATWLAIRQHLSNGATFVDVGAHEGYCSLNGARVVGPTGRVIGSKQIRRWFSRFKTTFAPAARMLLPSSRSPAPKQNEPP